MTNKQIKESPENDRILSEVLALEVKTSLEQKKDKNLSFVLSELGIEQHFN